SVVCLLAILTLVVSLFFFQAEDGIRDLYVTGVQTCALPIFLNLAVAPAGRVHVPTRDADPPARRPGSGSLPRPLRRAPRRTRRRSEERRVGKEWRARRSREQ